MDILLVILTAIFTQPFVLTRCSTSASGFRCPQSHFKCDAERCIPRMWVCDSEDDCGDGSDERRCDQRLCPNNMFRCDSGRCIRSNWVCDDDNDCGDNSDEKACENKNITCSPQQFSCQMSQKCISRTWVCDHDNDCGDASDERHCRHSSCSPSSFTCNNKKCIPARWKCDQDDDCGDGSDEGVLLCPKATCRPGFFSCANRRCISERWRCDGDNDCGDNSDEQPPACMVTPKSVCHSDEFMCHVASVSRLDRCIKKQWKCDGQRDCHDGSDEEGCTVPPTCGPDQFQCEENGRCLPKEKKCDGKKDCSGGEDEEDCVVSCRDDEFNCGDSNTCVNASKACDRVKDCPKGEDEPLNCFIDECKDHHGHCNHFCNDSLIGYKCTCKPGFVLEQDLRTCRDINECLIVGSCSQNCENTKGSFKCTCLSGYVLESNGRSCKAIGPRPYLVFSDRTSLRSLNFDSTEYRGVVRSLNSAIQVSHDIREGHLFWSDGREKAIFKAAMNNPEAHKIVIGQLNVPDGVAVDWIGRKLYWTDTGTNSIGVSELDGRWELSLLKTGLDEPRSLAIDPTQHKYGRSIYWTDWGRKPTGKIERISLDGDPTTRQVIHYLNGSWPNGLTIDFAARKLYWTDAKHRRIENSNFDGHNRRIVTEVKDQHPFSISVFEDFIFWTDWQNEAIFKANKFTGKEHTVIKRGLYSPMGIEVLHPLRQPTAGNPCGSINGGCSHLCLLSAVHHYRCRCPDGVNLLHDGKTCNTTDAYDCPRNFCYNGGECYNRTEVGVILPRCRCQHGYTGKRCEKVAPNPHTPSIKSPESNAISHRSPSTHEDLGTTIGMVVGVVVGILLIAGLLGYFFFRHIRQDYRDRKIVNFDNPVYRRTTEDSIPIMDDSPFDENLSQC